MTAAEPSLPAVLWWLPIAIVAQWVVVCVLLSALSRWPALARRYPGGPRPEGTRLRGHVGAVGVVPEHNVTGLVLATAGLYLYSHPFFRLGRAPVLLPWAAVRHRGAHRILWQRWHTLDLAGVTTLRVSDRAWQATAPYLQAGSGALLPNEGLHLSGPPGRPGAPAGIGAGIFSRASIARK